MNRRRIRDHLIVYLVMGLEPFNGRDALSIAREALEGGVTLLQLREKNAPLSQTIEIGGKIRDLCREYHVPFIVNDRLDVAIILEADGVHVGQDDIPCRLARELLGAGKIIGVSAGTPEEAERAIQDGADYLGVGAIYPTGTKADAGEAIGTGLIADIRQQHGIPIVGIGGIGASNAGQVIAAGADGVAVISAITRQNDPCVAASQLKQTVVQALQERL